MRQQVQTYRRSRPCTAATRHGASAGRSGRSSQFVCPSGACAGAFSPPSAGCTESASTERVRPRCCSVFVGDQAHESNVRNESTERLPGGFTTEEGEESWCFESLTAWGLLLSQAYPTSTTPPPGSPRGTSQWRRR